MTTKLWSSLFATTLVVLIYLAIFISVIVTGELPKVPKTTQQRGLNFTQAWADLHTLAARPHPYNSHANDFVHSFLLSRLKPIVDTNEHVHIIDDRGSNGTWGQTYFEGTNILVKIDGTEPDAVLFSAHYDSVSTSTGTTDNGMGVVALLQLVAKLAGTKIRRTAIFNFNNGEEDGLNGARVFLRHPWSNLTSTFLNLEGAASGGRPILFRGTSTTPLRAFRHAPHPHTNVLAANAFERGIIRSSTDYSVYTSDGHMQGLDFAFYKGRSRYHTRFDAIPWLEGGERALWAMMETMDGAGNALLDQEQSQGDQNAVYFDLFGRTMVLFQLSTLRIYDIVFLVVAPITVAILLVLQGKQKIDFGWIRFWIALLLSGAAQAVLVVMYVNLNPYIIYSSPYLTLISTFSLAYLTFFITLSLPIPFHKSDDSEITTNTILLHLLILVYILLLVPKFILPRPIGAGYIISAFATCVFVGWVVGSIMELTFIGGRSGHGEWEESRRYVRGIRFELPDGTENGVASDTAQGAHTENQEEETEPTEITPLIQQQREQQISSGSQEPKLGAALGRQGLWVLQLLLVLPLPVLLITHVMIILLGSLAQTVVDGGKVWIVYGAFSLISVSLLLPLAPFLPSPSYSQQSKRFSYARVISFLACGIFLFSIAYTSGLLGIVLTPFFSSDSRLGFPFTPEAPLKVFFEQHVQLLAQWDSTPNASSAVHTRAHTSLTGVPGYTDRMIIPGLPSATDKRVECTHGGTREALRRCTWESGDSMLPVPGWDVGKDWGVDNEGENWMAENINMGGSTSFLAKNLWLRSSTTRLSDTNVRITLKGTNTRACVVYFDESSAGRIKTWRVIGGSVGPSRASGEGVAQVKLWSRTWGREFVLDVEHWGPLIKGRVGCGWAEYESGTAFFENSKGRKGAQSRIPAYEEVIRFLPRWAVSTKSTDALAEVWSNFEV